MEEVEEMQMEEDGFVACEKKECFHNLLGAARHLRACPDYRFTFQLQIRIFKTFSHAVFAK